jgi:hypothetical protein
MGEYFSELGMITLQPSYLCAPCWGVGCLLPFWHACCYQFLYLARREEIYKKHVWGAFSQHLTAPWDMWSHLSAPCGQLHDDFIELTRVANRLAHTLYIWRIYRAIWDWVLYLLNLYIRLMFRRYRHLHLFFFGKHFLADELSFRILLKFCYIST